MSRSGTGVSICTLVRGRRSHLESQLRGLATQTVPPAELVIGYVQPHAFDGLPDVPFPVRSLMVRGEALPYAAVRNACAASATGSVLVFLDVDCTPAPRFVAELANVPEGRCRMAQVRYLAGDDPDPGDDFDGAWRAARTHPARRFGTSGTCAVEDPGEFWSTAFALNRADWDRTQGFDERYVGYGGEDTDFGRALAAEGIDLEWCAEARALHRWHAVQRPPLDALSSIVVNARRFRAKHGAWCMDYWLDQFEADGWVVRTGDDIRIVREPSAEERELARQPASVRFS